MVLFGHEAELHYHFSESTTSTGKELKQKYMRVRSRLSRLCAARVFVAGNGMKIALEITKRLCPKTEIFHLRKTKKLISFVMSRHDRAVHKTGFN